MRVVDSESTEPTLVHSRNGQRVWVMDSIAFASAAQSGDVIVTGSHGGTSAGEYAVQFGVRVVVCNDAGIGKNAAGVAGLRAIDAHGIAGIAVGHDSARIGDGEDIWENGTITYVNRTAAEAGIRVGAALSEEILAMVEGRTR
ncbi:hypothetical protein [Rhodococcoides yunnanense]|uniref:hypothetical protein n=1 Tax=Rhodococcoides yunnanense TaxID=278209 RepID=UPI0009355FFF|nr:hypothetical protein [Rhodococcus yunnanensis]